MLSNVIPTRTNGRPSGAKIKVTDLKWHPISIGGVITLRVCNPVMIDNFYVPVTANETRAMARKFGAFPLTRSVADHAFMQSPTKIPPRPQSEMYDFLKYTEYLQGRYSQYALSSGAHKLWVLSARGRSINYGFYLAMTKGGKFRAGTPLKETGYTVIQGLGAAHDGAHWDYSQLLQLMMAPSPLLWGGKKYSLRMALLEGVGAIWDEGARKLKPDDVP